VLSATPGSLIVACHGLCIPSFIGWTFLNESTTNSALLVYRCQHNKAPQYLMDHCTSVSDVAYRQRLRSASIVMKSLFHGTGSVPTNVGHLPLLARLCGTLCLRTCGIRMFLRTVTGESPPITGSVSSIHFNPLFTYSSHYMVGRRMEVIIFV